jgi:hypothetical protein
MKCRRFDLMPDSSSEMLRLSLKSRPSSTRRSRWQTELAANQTKHLAGACVLRQEVHKDL